MSDSPILICYDDSKGARHAIEVAAQLFSGRRAVVLDVAPPLTVAESYAAVGGVVPNFEEISQNGISARSIGRPAVVRANTGNKTCRFARCFQRERRDSYPRPPA